MDFAYHFVLQITVLIETLPVGGGMCSRPGGNTAVNNVLISTQYIQPFSAFGPEMYVLFLSSFQTRAANKRELFAVL